MNKTLLQQHSGFLVGLFCLSLIMRILLFVAFTQHDDHAFIYFDSNQYHERACSLATGNGLCDGQGNTTLYRLPGLPLFLAPFYWFFHHDFRAALWVHIIVSSAIPVLMFWLTRLLLPASISIAYGVSIVGALHVGLVLYSGMLATEPLTIVFLLLFLIFLLQPHRLGIAGLALGCASLIRPIGHYLVPLALILAFIQYRHIKPLLLLGIGWLVIVAPWLIRNFLLTGHLLFHSLPGLHFLQYPAAHVVMKRDNISYLDARKKLLARWNDTVQQEELRRGKALNEAERCIQGERLAFKYLLQNPWHAFTYGAVQLCKTCCGLYSAQLVMADTNDWPPNYLTASFWTKLKRFLMPTLKTSWLRWIIYYDILLTGLLLMGLLCFGYALVYDPHIRKVGTISGLIIFLTIGYGCARLRLPVEPLLIILATIGWQRVIDLVPWQFF